MTDHNQKVGSGDHSGAAIVTEARVEKARSGHADGASAGSDYAIQLSGITKRFGAVVANDGIDLDITRGTIHGIIGENGAGKSTLMSILYGFYQADEGEIRIDGTPVEIKGSDDAIAKGIGMVHQHFMLVDTFTVLENIVLGAEGGALLAEGAQTARDTLTQLTRDYSLEVDLDALVGDLPVGSQQRVEILKALYRGAEILILDEPTGVLAPQEADHLFRILDGLREQGKTILLITHKLREIMAATDNVSVMRAGTMVAHRQTAQTSPEELGELMVGRRVILDIEKQDPQLGDTWLQADGLSVVDDLGVARLKNVSLSVRSGEIVGIAGVSGNGQSELLDCLSGIQRPTLGTIEVKGQRVREATPQMMRELSVGHIPEDRLRRGVVKAFSAKESAILGFQDTPEYQSGMRLNWKNIVEHTRKLMAGFDVRPGDPELKSANFSGGNQQKLVLAREIDRDPDVLLIGQPTRGVDIGAIEFIHKRLMSLRDDGKAILLVSVELDEIMRLSDRIIVMYDGHLVGEVAGDQADERTLGLMMAGINPNESGPNEPVRPDAAPQETTVEGGAA